MTKRSSRAGMYKQLLCCVGLPLGEVTCNCGTVGLNPETVF